MARSRTGRSPQKRTADARPAGASAAGKQPVGSRTDPAVEEFMRSLRHPLKPALERLRQLILGVSPAIQEGIKWNSPSFRTSDYFATINVHRQEQLRLILHLGAKVKDNSSKGMKIADPSGLLQWLANDRALVTLSGEADVKANRKALEAIVRSWVAQL